MGLTIHYSGRFNSDSKLTHLIEEVKDVAIAHQWKFRIYEEQFPENALGKQKHDNKIYGISISPPECEPIYFTFLSNGRISSPVALQTFGNDNSSEYKDYIYSAFTKTQYAGIVVHKIIINLFRYLEKKYFAELSVFDESHYWETGNETILHEKFLEYDHIMDIFTEQLEKLPRQSGEVMDDYIQRIIQGMYPGKKD